MCFLCIFTITAEDVHSQQKEFSSETDNMSVSEDKQNEQQKKQITGRITDATGKTIIINLKQMKEKDEK